MGTNDNTSIPPFLKNGETKHVGLLEDSFFAKNKFQVAAKISSSCASNFSTRLLVAASLIALRFRKA